MQGNIVSAVFDNHSEAERAASDLRAAGVSDRAISVIAQHGGKTTTTDGGGASSDHDGDQPASFLSKAAAGSGVGALLGIAALAIPGVGPLAAAGAIAEAAVGGAALTGTAVGAAAGGLSSLLTDHGVSREDADYYSDRINNGGVFVSVNPSEAGIGREQIQDILQRNGGHSSTMTRVGGTGGSAMGGSSMGGSGMGGGGMSSGGSMGGTGMSGGGMGTTGGSTTY